MSRTKFRTDSRVSDTPQKNDRFSNHDEALYDEGFDSEGEQMFYDPVALDEDADDFIEEAIAEIKIEKFAREEEEEEAPIRRSLF